MNVKHKTLMILIVSVLVSVISTYAISYLICTNYIQQKESNDVKQGFGIVNSIINKEIANTKSRVTDYAHWDDTYEFLKGNNPRYINSNFSENTLAILNVNFMTYINSQGANIFKKTYDLRDDEIEELNKDINDELNKFTKLSNYENINDIRSGFLFSSGKLFIITCSPITTTDEKSEGNGVLIIGRAIDNSFLNYVKDISKLNLQFFDNENKQSYINNKILKINDDSIEITKTPSSIQAIKVLKDINGMDSINCSIILERSDYENGIYYFKIFSLVFFALMISILIIDYLIANKYVIKRIKVLQNLMEEIADFPKTDSIIKVNGKDEIAELAISTNKVLLQLDTAYKEISFLSYSDKLTGLKNRAFIEMKLKEMDNKENVNYWIILGDLNGLKLTNDTFGRAEGDKLLCAIADILKSICSDDEIIARWGGDAFIILVINKDNQYISSIIDKIKAACYKVKGFPFQLSIALGSAEKNDSCPNAEAVMNLAEERMYRNKLLEKKSSRGSTIISLERTLYEKHSETEEHTIRIKNLSTLLGKKLGLAQEKIDELELLGMLHDIGKIGITDNILMKPDKLTSDEWEIMKSHTEVGYRIATSTPELAHIAHEILCHHERFDGAGYPQGLKGNEIPLLSRIINIVDSFDVMTHSRCYKQAMSLDEAIEELKSCSGKQFDPFIVDVFITLLTVGWSDN